MDFSTSEWRMFVKAIDLRDQITHPKSFCECSIEIWDIEAVEQAEGWFLAMRNEFVRLAREHQKTTGWKPPGDSESIPLVAVDIYAEDAREWRNGADGSFLAATLLLAWPDPRLWFSASLVSHHAIEMLLKSALIRAGSVVTQERASQMLFGDTN